MQITVISVGKDRAGLFTAGVDEYAGRISRWAKVKNVELRAATVAAEGSAILKALPPRATLAALDVRGIGMSSEKFAVWLGQQRDASRDIAFVIGGDDGLADEVRARADLIVSLSAMTLPHRLARLVLFEQVYRAFSILAGEPYHRG